MSGKSIHGMCGTRIYTCWSHMKERCNNINHPKYHNWGGRGIKVCERWCDFRNFYADMGNVPKGLSLDRIENNGNYEPGNCRWATPKEQTHNCRPHKPFIDGPCKQYFFYGHGPNGEMVIWNSQTEIAKKLNLNQGNISNCLSGKQQTTKGWRFQWLIN